MPLGLVGAAATLLASAGPASASASTSPEVVAATSANWSGYVATGGSYTEVSGTFSVPRVSAYLAGSTASEWVGVDGWSNSSLVQAGVNEVPVGPGATLFEPWWEVVPGPQRLATGVMVRAGDRVSVKVAQISAGRWSISLVDETNGDKFSTLQSYSGPATSAEWVLEADTTTGGAPTKLTPLADKVTFSAATLDNAPAFAEASLESGAEAAAPPTSKPPTSAPTTSAAAPTPAGTVGPTTFTKVVMVQGGRAVSTPSVPAAGAFFVAYSPAPLPS